MKIIMDGTSYEIDLSFKSGAEFDFLRCLEPLIENRRIKELRIIAPEPPLRVTETVDYLEKFGYGLYDMDRLVDREETPTNERLTIRVKPYTQIWNKEFIKSVEGLPRFNFALEIGCFEGLTTNYICDNLLKDGGRIICVDPLEDAYDYDDDKIFIGQYERFIRNTRGRPVELIRKKSNEAFPLLATHEYRFDFIYVDGDHREETVYNDGTYSYFLCKPGGLILFDDYEYREETKRGIDKCLQGKKYDILKKGYQLLIRKTAPV